jgi:regulation of enolase protein 1 (concanavalin A-like superfamily)/fibronectin type 3 domain-containing protein
MRSDLAWSNVPGESAYYVQRSPDGQSGWLNVGYNTPDVTTFSDLSVPTSEGYHYRVVASAPAGFSRPSEVVTTAPQTSAYASADVASTPEGRTTVVAADTAFDVVAGGRNIFGPSDAFRFVYKPFTGDFDVSVRLTALAAVVSTTKAGLMARESLAADSRNVFSHAAANGDLRYSRRLETAGETTIAVGGTRATYPNVWLRLRRQADVFTAFGSVDGVNWTQTGADAPAVGNTVLVGMAVSAQSTTQTTTARFRELTEQPVQAPVAPAAPTGLSAAAASPTAIDLRWSASNGAASYRVERQGPGESGFTEVAADVAGTSFRDTTAQPQGAYAYRVRAQNAAGRSGYSATASATTPAAVPEAPAGLVVEATSPTLVELEWSPAAGATSYRLERRGPGEAGFTQVAAGLSANRYEDRGVAPDSTYAYRVRAENGSGLSPYGEIASVDTPAVVTGAYRGADVGDATPAGSTTTVSDGAAYDVTAGGTDIMGSTDRFHFAHQPRTGDFDVKVRVASLGRAHEWTKAGLMARESLSASSRNVFVMATPDQSGHRISSRFSDGGTTLTSGVGSVSYPNVWLRLKRQGSVFSGYRSTDGARWTLIGSRSLTVPQTVYFGMAVTSHNAQRTVVAQFRDLADVPPELPSAPAAPTGLVASSSSTSQVELTWDRSAGATGYRVERQGPGDADFAQVATVTGTGFTDAGRAEATTYAYRVRAANGVGLSGYSAAAFATTRAAYASVDISGSPAGSTNVVSAGVAYDVAGGGPDIFGQTDGFRFVHRQVTGDFDVKVRVQSLSAANASARAGLMARETLANNSRNAFASATAADGFRFTARTVANENTSLLKTGTVSYPNTWVRLRRTGDVFTGYFSTDGVGWTELSNVEMALPQTLYVGMAVSSFNTTSTATAEFRDLG